MSWDSAGITAPPGQTSLQGIAVAPNGDLWLAGNVPDAIYRSSDDGATWGAAISGPTGQTAVIGLAFDPRSAPAFADDTGDDADWTRGTAITPVVVPRASGSPAPTYAVVGNLPDGLTFTAPTETEDGEISGTPT